MPLIQQLGAKNRHALRRRDSYPHLTAIDLHNRDQDIRTNLDLLRYLTAEDQHPYLPRPSLKWLEASDTPVASVSTEKIVLLRHLTTSDLSLASNFPGDTQSHCPPGNAATPPRSDLRKPATPRLHRLWLIQFALCIVGWNSTADADLIYFRPSGSAMLPCESVGETRNVRFPDGTLQIPRNELIKWVAGFDPESEWNARRQQSKPNDLDSREACVLWAIENGLSVEVIAEILQIHRLDPSRARMTRMASMALALARPQSDPDVTRFRAALTVEMQVARGAHVLVLHQHSDAESAERVALLERVITGFYLTMASDGLDVTVPEQRLVSAYFANQSDYLTFLRQNEAGTFATTRGYFHPTWNAVVTFDDRSHQSQREARQTLERNRQELDRVREAADRSAPNVRLKLRTIGDAVVTVSRAEVRPTLERLERGLATQMFLLDLDRRAVDLGTAAHEVIHQLVIGSGLAPRHDAFPQWLHEGFASQFEVIRSGRWAGISRAHDLRLPDWRRIQPQPNLERLVRDGGFGHGYQRDVYAQAWALVYFLRTQRPDQFLSFLDLLRGSSLPLSTIDGPDHQPSERVMKSFQQAFGPDLPKLEREWHTFMASVQTPLEIHAPTGPKSSKSPLPAPPSRK